jgi:hypothetical protein
MDYRFDIAFAFYKLGTASDLMLSGVDIRYSYPSDAIGEFHDEQSRTSESIGPQQKRQPLSHVEKYGREFA